MAPELSISRRTVSRVVKRDLGLKIYKMQTTHALDDKMRATRLQCCRDLLKRFSRGRHCSIVFSDEKLFTVEMSFNKQNNRVIAKSIQDANNNGRMVQRKGHAASVMVWAAVTSDGSLAPWFSCLRVSK